MAREASSSVEEYRLADIESLAEFRRPQTTESNEVCFFRGHVPRKKHFSACKRASAASATQQAASLRKNACIFESACRQSRQAHLPGIEWPGRSFACRMIPIAAPGAGLWDPPAQRDPPVQQGRQALPVRPDRGRAPRGQPGPQEPKDPQVPRVPQEPPAPLERRERPGPPDPQVPLTARPGPLEPLPRQYMHNKENAVTMRLSAH